jgi:DNA helicase-2/ATP-dependent DNA helicase PcrA
VPAVDAARVATLKAAWEEMYGARRLAFLPGGEPMAELRFVLKLGAGTVRGRMDAVYENPEGGLEIVDFKTGNRAETPDLDQLTVYAGALRNLGIGLGGNLRLTYAYLGSGEQCSRDMNPSQIDAALEELTSKLSGVLERPG